MEEGQGHSARGMKDRVVAWILLCAIAWILYAVSSDPDRADPRWDAHSQELNLDQSCPTECPPVWRAKTWHQPNQPAPASEANPAS